MKILLNKWIFIAQFHFQDPDSDSEYGSGSSLVIWIRIYPDPQHWSVGTHLERLQTHFYFLHYFKNLGGKYRF